MLKKEKIVSIKKTSFRVIGKDQKKIGAEYNMIVKSKDFRIRHVFDPESSAYKMSTSECVKWG